MSECFAERDQGLPSRQLLLPTMLPTVAAVKGAEHRFHVTAVRGLRGAAGGALPVQSHLFC
jgi:hypothetical protein